ncbi:hypothetical protein FH972_023104 [Carpinus fangiana]|uniref:Uncharacterized protein n=1 Tax=Carpinus fangiana TaxID=176857 RepID=A0A5N6KUH0_9ROSI|nr:hypothetical protein FH972_023104 [Carpinus fangiana]
MQTSSGLSGRAYLISVGVAVLLPLSSLLMLNLWETLGRPPQTTTTSGIEERPSCITPPEVGFTTTRRISFGDTGSTIRAYPSSGGIIKLPFDIVVAKYLGADRLSITLRKDDRFDEDALSRQLRLLGGKWWQSEYDWGMKLVGIRKSTNAEWQEMIVGWPSDGSGVLVLRFDGRDHEFEISRLRMCLSMDERCDILREWHAEFYSDPTTVSEFEGLLQS